MVIAELLPQPVQVKLGWHTKSLNTKENILIFFFHLNSNASLQLLHTADISRGVE